MSLRHLTRALGVGWLGLALGVAGAGEAPPTTVPAAPTVSTTLPEAIAASDISTRAERTNAELRDWETRLVETSEVSKIGKGLPRVRNELLRLAARNLDDATEVSPREIDDVQREWHLAREQLASWTETIAKRIQGLETGLARFRELDDTWARTADAAARDGLPEAVTREIGAVRASVRAVQARARAQRDGLLTLASQIGTLQGPVSEGLQSVTAATARMDTDLLVTDSPSLWVALREGVGTEPLADTLARTWGRNLEHIRIAVGLDRARIGKEVLVFLVLLSTMLAVRNRSRTWPPDDPALPHVLVIARRPVSATLLVAVLLHWLFSGMVPLVVGDAASLLILVPVLCLLYDRLHAKLRTLAVAGAALFLLVSVRRVLPVASTDARLLLAVENLLAALWTLWAVRPHQLARLALSPAQQRWLLYAARVAIALFAAALISNLVGNVSLAMVITRAVLGSTFLGLLLYETRRVVEGLVVAALHAPDRVLLKAAANHAPALRRRLSTVVRVVAAAAWVIGTLDIVGALSPVTGVVAGMLSARLEIGALSLSASDVLAFVLTVWLSLVIARVVRVVLQDDVLPRMDLPRGVPSAVSATANYTVLFVGFLLALSAAGIDLGRITILAGALGVGIGFGLQNIVNNFVSGLILLLERPIRLGDVIEFGGVAGWVSRIGIRSSTIETFEGAEVIVPNAMLIAERVTNWTYSASQRRIEVLVGVAYGTDPNVVLALLERVAAAQEDLLRQPAPQALFLGFGQSSLDFALRAWTSSYDQAAVTRSRLAVAVHAALRDAEIEIPFPQREFRVRATAPAPNRS